MINTDHYQQIADAAALNEYVSGLELSEGQQNKLLGK